MMKRRVFIRNVAITSALYPFLNTLSACKTKTGSKQNQKFIFIQLTGGNDGLNTLIPIDRYKQIIAARPNLFIPENKTLAIKGNDTNALHPSMEGIREMYNNGLITFVQGVGYENQNYSHFRSQDIWLSGSDATNVLYTGWMARFLETRFKNYPEGFPSAQHPDPPAIKVGDMGSFLFQGNNMDLSIVKDAQSLEFDTRKADLNASEPEGLAAQEVKSIREILLQTDRYAKVISNAIDVPFQHSKLYPKQGENPLADQLKMVARLINGGLQTSVYHVDLKGFDTHSAQVDPTNTTKGAHADLLAQLSQALVCFWDDVTKMGREDEITGMSFSEFGRRIVSNSAHGTDHGAAQPLMFFGTGIHPGIIGSNPVIAEKVNNTDNLAMQFDYRSIYASILNNWMDVSKDQVKDVLNGSFEPVKIFKY